MQNHRNTASRRRWLAAAAALLATPWMAGPALAQGGADKPVRILVGAPPGGTSDLLARLVGDGLAKALGQPVIVENKPGALGAIVMDSFMSAPRDGSTLLLAVNGLFTEIPHTLKPKYDPLKDVRPLVEIAGSGLVLVGNTALPPKTLPEMIGWVKANPGKVNFASYSPGTLSHVLGLQLNQLAGLDMQHIGYKGSPPALQDLMGGQVQFMFDGLATSLPNIKAGKLRALAVSSPERSPVLPEVPTLAELGYKDMTRTAWIGFFVHPEAPAAAQQRLRVETLKVLAMPALRERLAALGLAVNTSAPPTPEQMSASIAADHRSMGEMLRSVNYKPE